MVNFDKTIFQTELAKLRHPFIYTNYWWYFKG